MAEPRFLVTGAHGCIGAWVTRELVSAGLPVTTFDLSSERGRLRLLFGDEELSAVPHVAGDITDLAAFKRALQEHRITNVVHLAALQVPFCRADPPLGASVNVVGTVNVFEAAKSLRLTAPIVYASSVAALDVHGSIAGDAATIYGVYKRANEGAAVVYFQDEGVSSIGLRPHTVYGVGRDQGLTSAPTVAMVAAAAGVPYTIPYGGAAQFQLARDVARAFIGASLSGYAGASVHGLPDPVATVQEVVAAITAAAPGCEVGFKGEPLPFPEDAGSASFAEIVSGYAATPLADGVAETVERFRTLLAQGRISAPAPVG